ncbi:MAG: Lrp/AsnC family transcriptional regulator [Aigarchaeota archaeon]|nr:Lrp/AsnC family transcriptional regulator [Candidatus Calditenuaceae archaeon]
MGGGMEELDEKDLAILRLLQRDARTPASVIAQRIGVPENTVRFRMRRLVERGVIRGFVALVDPRKVGLSVSAAFMIKLDPERREEAINELRGWEEIVNIYQFSGEYDLIAVAFVKGLAELQSLIDKVKGVKGVRETNVLVTTRVIKAQSVFSLQ